MKFKNQKGKELKTTISDDIMNQLAGIVEDDLKNHGIFYLRTGTEFQVKQKDFNSLLIAQTEANKKLIEKGIITLDMISKDFANNF